jgi:glycosyltransferase involved in cell wall biosynthesis
VRGVVRAWRTGTSLRHAGPGNPLAQFGPRGATAHDAGPILYLPAVAWSYRFQRPQQLATALARHGHAVLYVDPFRRTWIRPSHRLRQVASGVFRLEMGLTRRPDPYRCTFPGSSVPRWASVLAACAASAPAMVLAQLPFWSPLATELSRGLRVPLVYDRIDLHAAFPGMPESVFANEEHLLTEAHLVSASSQVLLDDAERLARQRLLVRNAVELEFFRPTASRRRSPLETGPVAGYVGALQDWIDFPALEHAASSMPDWRFVLAGSVEVPGARRLRRLANVTLLGEIPYHRVPKFLAEIDVSLIPFRATPLTRAVDPVKLYESLAAGVPVVARRLPELARWSEPEVFHYERPAELVEALRRSIASISPAEAAARRRSVETETWHERARDLLAAVHSLATVAT